MGWSAALLQAVDCRQIIITIGSYSRKPRGGSPLAGANLVQTSRRKLLPLSDRPERSTCYQTVTPHATRCHSARRVRAPSSPPDFLSL